MITQQENKMPIRTRTSEMAVGKTIYTVTTSFSETADVTVEDRFVRYVADRVALGITYDCTG